MCAKLKVEVIEKDVLETNETRALLNFGHTIGHAIESVELGKLPHGHAISLGMIAAARISESVTGFDPSDTQQLIGLLKRYGLPIHFSGNLRSVQLAIQYDKKTIDKSAQWVLLKKIGEAQSGVAVDDVIVTNVLKNIKTTQ